LRPSPVRPARWRAADCRAKFAILNETHHWVAANQSHEMAQTIAGNVGKSRGGGARTMEITNAPLPGEDSVAELTWHAWSKVAEGKARDSGMYYDSVEAPPVDLANPEQLRAGIVSARGDADWLDVDWIVSAIHSGVMPRARSQRMFLNQLVTAEDQLISPEDWDSCVTDDELKPGDEITLGFDGGKSDDSTCLLAVRVRDRRYSPWRCGSAPTVRSATAGRSTAGRWTVRSTTPWSGTPCRRSSRTSRCGKATSTHGRRTTGIGS